MSEEQRIIDQADLMDERTHKRAMREIELQHERRDKIIEKVLDPAFITAILGVPALLVLLWTMGEHVRFQQQAEVIEYQDLLLEECRRDNADLR